MKPKKILIVDDDPAIQSLLTFRLEKKGYQVVALDSGEAVLEALPNEFDYDLVLLDVILPGIQGIEVLEHIKAERENITVIVLTAHPSLVFGVSAIKKGAYDFICKPFDTTQLLNIVDHALENQRLKADNQILRQVLQAPKGTSAMIGKSAAMKQVTKLIRQTANSRATVLISGESGTGKEVVAQAVHHQSQIRQAPFVVVNCGAIPETLVESELFGYEKGAFTGAVKSTMGKFEQAHNGSIFLDEIGELSLAAQVKLLRVIQEKEVIRVGGTQRISLNFRLICATNRDLSVEVAAGRFREDLYYRIALFLIDVPRLDARGKDIILLANHFLEKFAQLEGRNKLALSPEAEQQLLGVNWPGNVRELENCIYRSILSAPDKDVFQPEDIVFLQRHQPIASQPSLPEQSDGILPLTLLEGRAIQQALEKTQGNIKQAADALEISRGTLYRKMKENNLNKAGQPTD